MEIRLADIYSMELSGDVAHSVLYRLLAEREPDESISHEGMPTFKEHTDFIKRKPYKGWYLVIQGEGNIVGSVYLSYHNEIGIAIFKKYRRNGYAKAAIKKLMEIHSTEKYFLANINPANAKSISLFQNTLGFSLIQNTFKLNAEQNNVVS